eukprot:10229548-Alexandrium_andersonii.AAC.1
MSASLVGSEMCIRDSTPDRAAPKGQRLRDRSGPNCFGAVSPFFDRCKGCLLYTSDAADDM